MDKKSRKFDTLTRVYPWDIQSRQKGAAIMHKQNLYMVHLYGAGFSLDYVFPD